MSEMDLEVLWRLKPQEQTWPDSENVAPPQTDIDDVMEVIGGLNPDEVPLLVKMIMWAAQGAILGSLIGAVIQAIKAVL